MAITRIDSHFYRGERAARDVSSYVAVNALLTPAHFVFAGAAAAREGLGSQVAYRLALDYFLSGVVDHYGSTPDIHGNRKGEQSDDAEPVAVGVLHDAFRSANASVYSFGHKLAAGGRMSASLLGLVIDSGRLAAGRCGIGSVYLYRDGGLMPFFENSEESERIGDAAEFADLDAARKLSFIGANSLVDVEVASVELSGGDIICAFSRPLTQLNETLLIEALESAEFGHQSDVVTTPSDNRARALCREIFTEPDTLSYAMITQLGPDTIYCDRFAAESDQLQ
jgi:hypothetical protein